MLVRPRVLNLNLPRALYRVISLPLMSMITRSFVTSSWTIKWWLGVALMLKTLLSGDRRVPISVEVFTRDSKSALSIGWPGLLGSSRMKTLLPEQMILVMCWLTASFSRLPEPGTSTLKRLYPSYLLLLYIVGAAGRL